MRVAARALLEVERWTRWLAARRKGNHGEQAVAKQPSRILPLWQKLFGFWQLLFSQIQVRSSGRRLRFIERVPLGDKQFVALLEFDGAGFLVSGGPGGGVTLTPAHSLKPENIKPASVPRRSTARKIRSNGNQRKTGARNRGAAKPMSIPAAAPSGEQMAARTGRPVADAEPHIALNILSAEKLLPDGTEVHKEAEATPPFQDFAALLELRTLATQVFEQADAGTPVVTPDGTIPVGRGEPTAKGVRALQHRVRNGLSISVCLLLMPVVPCRTAHASRLPTSVLQVSATQVNVASVLVSAPILSGRVQSLPAMLVPPIAPTILAFARRARTDSSSSSDEIRVSGLNGLGGSSASWGIVVLLTLLTLIPSLLLCVTPFARLLIVFHFLRQALGLQTTPSNQTLIGLSLILTFFIMQPVGAVIYRNSVLPVQAGKLTPLDGVVRAGEPLRHFMAHYVREKDAELFLDIAKEPRPHSIDELSMRVMLPAYILSELKAGFQIGTVLFLPFLIVDMVVASITTSVGMMQLPPVVISTPLKLLLFLMVDGWHLLIGALMRSFN